MVTVPIFVVPDSKSSQRQVEVGSATIDLSKLSGPAQVEEAKELHLKGIVATHFKFSNKEE